MTCTPLPVNERTIPPASASVDVEGCADIGVGGRVGGGRLLDGAGLWLQCRHMTATIQKWGHSLALRIPLAVAKQIQVQEGDAVTLRVSAAGLTVKPTPKRLNLDELLAQMTPENLHPATDWGADVGREVLPP